MMIRRKETGRILIGAAVAAGLGLGLGAWMTPSMAESPDPDPYENVVITLPADQTASATQLTAADWGAYPTTGASIWPTADSGPSQTAYLAPIRWDAPAADSADDAGLTLDQLDAALPDPAAADPAAARPATQPPAAQPPTGQPPIAQPAVQVSQAAAAGPAPRLQPGDWDLPDNAYQRASDKG